MMIFAALRKLFAADRAFESVGAAITDGIERIIIPYLQKKKEQTEEVVPMTTLIDEFRKLAKSQWMKDFSEKAIRNAVRNADIYDESETVSVDIAADMAGDFLMNTNLRGVFHKFNPLDGPTKFRTYVGYIVYIQALQRARRKHENKTLPSGVDLRKHEWDKPVEKTEEFETFFEDFRQEIPDYIHRFGDNYKTEIALEIFGIFINLADKSEDLSVNPEMMKNVWEKKRQKQGKGFSRVNYYDGWGIMKKAIKQYLIDHKRDASLNASVVERIVRTEYRKIIAKWILGE